MTDTEQSPTGAIDPDALRSRYRAERDKRRRADGARQLVGPS